MFIVFLLNLLLNMLEIASEFNLIYYEELAKFLVYLYGGRDFMCFLFLLTVSCEKRWKLGCWLLYFPLSLLLAWLHLLPRKIQVTPEYVSIQDLAAAAEPPKSRRKHSTQRLSGHFWTFVFHVTQCVKEVSFK